MALLRLLSSFCTLLLGLSATTHCKSEDLPVVALLVSERFQLPAASRIGEGILPRFNIKTRGWTKSGICSPHSRNCSLHTPSRRGITTRSGDPRCRTGSGVSLVSPRETTMSICHPARLGPSSTHDRTTEPLASPGWALTAASCILMSCCRAAVGFSELPSALRAQRWSRVVSHAGAWTNSLFSTPCRRACLRASDFDKQLAGVTRWACSVPHQ